jgi:hypothetical protein
MIWIECHWKPVDLRTMPRRSWTRSFTDVRVDPDAEINASLVVTLDVCADTRPRRAEDMGHV